MQNIYLNANYCTVRVFDFQAASSAIIRLLIAFHADTELMAFVHWVSPEYVKSGHPNDCVRVNLFVDVANIELCAGLLETSAVMVNSVNFAIAIHQHCGRDELLMYMIVLLTIFSPHRYMAKPNLLAAVTPLHAKLLEFLRQYLEDSYRQRALSSQNHMLRVYQNQRSPQKPSARLPHCQTLISQASASTSPSPSPSDQHVRSHCVTTGSQCPVATNMQTNMNSGDAHSSSLCNSGAPIRGSHRFPVNITPDFEHSTMLGVHLSGLANLSDEQRQHLKSLIVNVQICKQLDCRMLQQFGITTAPKCPVRGEIQFHKHRIEFVS